MWAQKNQDIVLAELHMYLRYLRAQLASDGQTHHHSEATHYLHNGMKIHNGRHPSHHDGQ
jgi:hypothetical protein